MAVKKTSTAKATPKETVAKVARYKGKQLLRVDKYNNRIARIVLETEKDYSFAEADELITNYSKKKG